MAPAFHATPQRDARWPTNLGLGIVNAAIAIAVPLTAVSAALWAERHDVGLLNTVSTPAWLAFIATLALRSLAGYLFHLAMHKVPLLWRVHRVHHLDTHLDVSTALRSHPIEVLVAALIMSVVSVLFGLSAWALVMYELWDACAGAYSHANLRLPERLDRLLRTVLVTPNMHCLHHSSWRPETDSNYGTVFAFWDRLFGTYSDAPRAGYEAMRLGLEEVRDARTSSFWWQIRSPALSLSGEPAPRSDAVPPGPPASGP
jgi:sterol desaturase/sphingolipid hydroxylase (fatty acid hydroxylase superfamily)